MSMKKRFGVGLQLNFFLLWIGGLVSHAGVAAGIWARLIVARLVDRAAWLSRDWGVERLSHMTFEIILI